MLCHNFIKLNPALFLVLPTCNYIFHLKSKQYRLYFVDRPTGIYQKLTLKPWHIISANAHWPIMKLYLVQHALQSVMRRKRQNTRKQKPHAHPLYAKGAVNIYKTEKSFEMLVFAPGGIKEHFHPGVNGNELTVSYTTPRICPARIDVTGIQPWQF